MLRYVALLRTVATAKRGQLTFFFLALVVPCILTVAAATGLIEVGVKAGERQEKQARDVKLAAGRVSGQRSRSTKEVWHAE